jgi:hypothetical protein
VCPDEELAIFAQDYKRAIDMVPRPIPIIT